MLYFESSQCCQPKHRSGAGASITAHTCVLTAWPWPVCTSVRVPTRAARVPASFQMGPAKEHGPDSKHIAASDVNP